MLINVTKKILKINKGKANNEKKNMVRKPKIPSRPDA